MSTTMCSTSRIDRVARLAGIASARAMLSENNVAATLPPASCKNLRRLTSRITHHPDVTGGPHATLSEHPPRDGARDANAAAPYPDPSNAVQPATTIAQQTHKKLTSGRRADAGESPSVLVVAEEVANLGDRARICEHRDVPTLGMDLQQ